MRPAQLSALARNLSGGNQQKVVLARWLSLGVNVLILDNPTRGVDAGAKTQIYALLRALIDQGMSIVLISDDILELIGLCNRIAIMRGGRMVREFPAPYGAKPHEAELVAAMV
ncbi:Vitamin B12 import ATP-binding protein BtuD [compost metagenome]